MRKIVLAVVALLSMNAVAETGSGGVVVRKRLVNVGLCEDLGKVAGIKVKGKKITLSYIEEVVSLESEKVTDLNSYFIRLFNAHAIRRVGSVRERLSTEDILFGASYESTAEAQCKAAHEEFLKIMSQLY